MIGYLKGKILFKGKDFLIIEVNGVGYKVFVSKNTFPKVDNQKGEVEFFVWPYLKRETIELYGCPNQEEFSLFTLLEALPGIGPKTALSLASIGSLEKLKRAVEKEDDEFLSSIGGIGKKRRQRLLLELTGKLREIEGQKPLQGDESLEALIALGFSRQRAKQALLRVSKEIKETGERVTQALKILGKE